MKISLIIPTKNRVETLEYCVKSCLASQYQNCEIIVSNNHSDDRTAEFLAQLNDPRLKILTTPSPLSMRANFEFALDHATGDYIFYIGDDDGITNFGFEALEYLIRNSGADAINWTPLPYIWPNTVGPEALSSLVIKKQNLSTEYEQLDADKIFENFVQGTVSSYMDGAKIYHGCVARSLIEKVRQKTGGLYFGAMSPDVFAAIANLKFLDKFIATRCSISISGKSAKSNGWANIKSTGDRKQADLFFKDSEASKVADPRSIVDLKIRSLRVHELDALMLVNELVFDNKVEINYRKWLELVAENLTCSDPAEHQVSADKLKNLAELLNVPAPVIPRFRAQQSDMSNYLTEKTKIRLKHIRCYSNRINNVETAAQAAFYDADKVGAENSVSRLFNWWKFQLNFGNNLQV